MWRIAVRIWRQRPCRPAPRDRCCLAIGETSPPRLSLRRTRRQTGFVAPLQSTHNAPKSTLWANFSSTTRLHQFARSLLYNATASGTLWWFRKSHSINYANHQHLPFARRRHDFRQAAARRFKLHFSPIVWWKFHENPFSYSRERLSHSFGGRKKNKKTKKNKKKTKKNCKTYMHPPPTGRQLRKLARGNRRILYA